MATFVPKFCHQELSKIAQFGHTAAWFLVKKSLFLLWGQQQQEDELLLNLFTKARGGALLSLRKMNLKFLGPKNFLKQRTTRANFFKVWTYTNEQTNLVLPSVLFVILHPENVQSRMAKIGQWWVQLTKKLMIGWFRMQI